MDSYTDRAESIIEKKKKDGTWDPTANCGKISEAERLFPIQASKVPPPPPRKPSPPPPHAPNPGADLRRAIGKDDGGMYDPTSAAALAASLEASNNIDMLLQGGKFVADLPLDR